MLNIKSFEEFLFEKNMTVKRRYSQYSAIKAKQHTSVRHEILKYIAHNGWVSSGDMRTFLDQLNKKTGRHTKLNLLYSYVNRRYLKSVNRNNRTYFKITPIGMRILKMNESLDGGSMTMPSSMQNNGGGYSTLQNTPGMGNVMPASPDKIGSGDSLDSVDWPKEKDEDKFNKGDKILYKNKHAVIISCCNGNKAIIKLLDSGENISVKTENIDKL